MLFEELRELFDHKNYLELKHRLTHLQEADIAEFIDTLEDGKAIIIVFRLLNKTVAADVFAYLSGESQTAICGLINDEELRSILDEISFDDKIDLLEEVPAYLVKRIINQRGEKERKLINQFLNYEDGTAGSLMTIEFVDLHKDMSTRDAMRRIRRDGVDKETVYTCYVIDDARRLEGTVSLKDIVLAEENAYMADIMVAEPICVHTGEDQEQVAELFQKYDLLAVPVVDGEHRLVGIITVDDIMDVVEEETTEDIYKMGAVAPGDLPYSETGVLKLAMQRLPWLLILMVSATFTGIIIRNFESALSSAVALASFIPVLMDTGGNSGSQTSITVIRAITLGDIKFSDLFRVLFKELRVSLIAGLVLGLVNFARILWLDGQPAEIALVVSVTLMGTVIFAKMLGGALPLAAHRLGLDPALMASPLITTIVDAVSLLLYFAVATTMLHI